MDVEDILQLIQAGEGINIEFKESKTSPTKDLYQTICAYLNRIGGYILLGVKDNGKIIGVNSESVSKIKKEIVTSANNPLKINPPVSLMVDDIKINDKITQKTTQKTTQKILELIRENPYITRKELAKKIDNITEDGIKYYLKRLKEKGILKRIGPDKGGYWEIIEWVWTYVIPKPNQTITKISFEKS